MREDGDEPIAIDIDARRNAELEVRENERIEAVRVERHVLERDAHVAKNARDGALGPTVTDVVDTDVEAVARSLRPAHEVRRASAGDRVRVEEGDREAAPREVRACDQPAQAAADDGDVDTLGSRAAHASPLDLCFCVLMARLARCGHCPHEVHPNVALVHIEPFAYPGGRPMAHHESSYHHGNLRRALLDAALALIAERDSVDFTMRELARRAEVTHNAPYRHFDAKDALLAALAEEGFAKLRERLGGKAAKAGDPRTRVRDLGESYVMFAVEHPHHFRLMFGGTIARVKESHPALARAAEASFALLRDAIEACREEGLLRHDVSTRDLGLVAWSLVHGLASLLMSGQIPGGGTRVPALARKLAAVFFDGALFHGPEGPRARQA